MGYKRYTDQEKEAIVQAILKTGKPVATARRELGITASYLSCLEWIKRYKYDIGGEAAPWAKDKNPLNTEAITKLNNIINICKDKYGIKVTAEEYCSFLIERSDEKEFIKHKADQLNKLLNGNDKE